MKHIIVMLPGVTTFGRTCRLVFDSSDSMAATDPGLCGGMTLKHDDKEFVTCWEGGGRQGVGSGRGVRVQRTREESVCRAGMGAGERADR